MVCLTILHACGMIYTSQISQQQKTTTIHYTYVQFKIPYTVLGNLATYTFDPSFISIHLHIISKIFTIIVLLVNVLDNSESI